MKSMKYLNHMLIFGAVLVLGVVAALVTVNVPSAEAAPKSPSCQSQPRQAKCQTNSNTPSSKPSPSRKPSTAAKPAAPKPTAAPKPPVAVAPPVEVAPPTTEAPTAAPQPPVAVVPPATQAPTTPAAPAATAPVASKYPVHTNIVSTTFWVGEIFNASLSDGSQVCSTYDAQWAFRHTGINEGVTPASADGCAGSIYGGCDGVSTGTGASFTCATESRDAANGYFPKNQPQPLENPFYLDLPFDDVNDSTAFKQRCQVIPWAAADNAATGKDNCANGEYSYMKNRWVQLTGPNGNTCYGQIEDAGPSSGSLYHDANYVFGSQDARPANTQFSGDPSQGAGMDVSPALNGCLGFASLDGDNDHVSWQFVDSADVPAGPWKNVVTTSGVNW